MFSKETMNDRLTAVALLCFFVFAFYNIHIIEVPFSPDPLGPRVFPKILAGLGIVASIYLLLLPGKNKKALVKSQIIKLIIMWFILLFYAFAFEKIGYLLSTMIITAIVAYMFNLPIVTTIIYAVLLSLISYVLFVNVLELNLPEQLLEDKVNLLFQLIKGVGA